VLQEARFKVRGLGQLQGRPAVVPVHAAMAAHRAWIRVAVPAQPPDDEFPASGRAQGGEGPASPRATAWLPSAVLRGGGSGGSSPLLAARAVFARLLLNDDDVDAAAAVVRAHVKALPAPPHITAALGDAAVRALPALAGLATESRESAGGGGGGAVTMAGVCDAWRAFAAACLAPGPTAATAPPADATAVTPTAGIRPADTPPAPAPLVAVTQVCVEGRRVRGGASCACREGRSSPMSALHR
jgi:hypothetical protein